MVARKRSVSAAARDLNMTQSAISHSVKALEEEAGFQLLHKSGKRLRLTPVGEQLYHDGERILGQMDQLRERLDHLANWGTHRLHVGASTTACEYFLPEVLRRFKRSFPSSWIAIHPGDTPEQIDAVVDNQVDLAVILEPQSSSAVTTYPLFSDQMGFVVSPQHPWAQFDEPPSEDFEEQAYILYNKKSNTYRLIEAFFHSHGVKPNAVIEFGSMEAIKELVKLDLGVSILARWVLARELSEGSLLFLPPKKKAIKRHWVVAHRSNRTLSWAEQSFVDYCRSVAADLFPKMS